MAAEYVVDAHTLVWFFAGNQKLGLAARRILENPSATLILPAIALAEACWLAEKGRANIGSVADVLRKVSSDARIRVDSLDQDLSRRSYQLGWDGEMHDRQIVATALRAGSVAVLTTDSAIRDSGLVPTIWD